MLGMGIILAVDDETVTYRYKDRAADRQRKETVATSSSGASSSTSCRPASTRSAITAYGMPRAANRCAT